MKLVTVATHSDGYFPWLRASCARLGAELVVLGWGQPWKGFAWRFDLMARYLTTLPEDEVVCFVDAYDVILLRPLALMEARFRALHRRHGFDVLVSREHAAGALQKAAAAFTFGACRGMPISAGAYMGRAGDLLRVLTRIRARDADPAADDQRLLAAFCRDEPGRVHVDADSRVFLTTVASFRDAAAAASTEGLMQGDPCIFHGAANTSLDALIRGRGYAFSQQDSDRLRAYHGKAQVKKLAYYLGLTAPTTHLLLAIGAACLLVIWSVRRHLAGAR